MSDTPTENEPSPEPQGTEATTDATDPTTDPARETDWKAEARKWEALAKKNKSAADKLTEIEEASKTEAQKQAERLAEFEAKVKEYETREQVAAWKAEVAEATGVPAVALAGSTKEEIEAHAATLKPLIATQSPRTPRPDPTQGAGQVAVGSTADQFAAAFQSHLS